jgi:predicted dehydrogenase
MSDTIRWGILATGDIARQFVSDLSKIEEGEVVAVGSRSQEKADVFADQWGIPNRHGSYEALVADPDIDIIYIATPHNYHLENATLALNAGKHVLCEKPMAVNAAEVERMIDAARRNNRFLMEAMWTYFIPAMRKVFELIGQGAIGEVRLLQANFGVMAPWKVDSRLFSRELAGGTLLDIGVYAIALSYLVFGQDPTGMKSTVHLGETGVDEQEALLLDYPNGAFASLVVALRAAVGQHAVIAGTQGQIEIPRFSQPDQIVLKRGEGDREELSFDRIGYGYAHQALDVMACLRSGRTESDIMPLSRTLAVARTMDAFRQDWGLRYPGE